MNVIFGLNSRPGKNFKDEIEFAKSNNLKFLQIWYDSDGIFKKNDNDSQVEMFLHEGYPVIIHAVLDINEIDYHIEKLIQINKKLGSTELIMHPVCQSEAIGEDTIYKLSKAVAKNLQYLKETGITLYVENNSRIDPILNSIQDIEIFFNENPDAGFLLDLAHIDDYEHLEKIIKIKYPKILHLADRNLSVIHEHLPVGQGNIDFELIFQKHLNKFDGRIIFELAHEDKEVIDSIERIKKIIQ